jgi:hypothetical protein
MLDFLFMFFVLFSFSFQAHQWVGSWLTKSNHLSLFQPYFSISATAGGKIFRKFNSISRRKPDATGFSPLYTVLGFKGILPKKFLRLSI